MFEAGLWKCHRRPQLTLLLGCEQHELPFEASADCSYPSVIACIDAWRVTVFSYVLKNNNFVTSTLMASLIILGEEMPDERKSGFKFE